MTNIKFYLTQGQRMLRNKFKQFKRYAGNAEEICNHILKNCWNGRFFQTSTTNFPQFWTRDFGMCTESLIKLGYTKEVEQTLRYALAIFSLHNKITTTITPDDRLFDFPTHAVDTLPWLIHSIALTKNKKLVDDFRPFLEQQVNKFTKTFVDQSGLVKPYHYSSIKDFAIRKSSCYDNCMLGMLQQDMKALKLNNPIEHFDYEKILMNYFWNGNYFYDDMSKRNYIAGDANLFPFHCNIIKSKSILKKAFQSIHDAQLDEPFPLKYTEKNANVKFIIQEIFMHNYERDSIWLHLGPLYVNLLKTIDKKRAQLYIDRYTKMIEHFGTFPEVLTAKGKPFTAPFYHCDQGMLWCANYVVL